MEKPLSASLLDKGSYTDVHPGGPYAVLPKAIPQGRSIFLLPVGESPSEWTKLPRGGFQYWVDTYYWFMQHVMLASCVNLCLGHAQDEIFIATLGRISRWPPPPWPRICPQETRCLEESALNGSPACPHPTTYGKAPFEGPHLKCLPAYSFVQGGDSVHPWVPCSC